MKHILVLRFSSMGDVAMTVPVVMHVLYKYPDIKIFFATQKKFFPLFPIHDRLVLLDVDINNKHKKLIGLFQLFFALRKQKIDCVADLHNVIRSKIISLCFMIFGKKIATLDKQRFLRKQLLKQCPVTLIPNIQKYAQVFSKIGYPITLSQNVLQVSEKPNRDYMIGFAPFASFTSKELQPAISVQVVEHMLDKYPQATIYLLGGLEDDLKMKLFPKHPRVYYLHTLTLQQQIAYIQKMDILLSMDSANMHIASLYQIPVISIWCGTSPKAGFLGFQQNIQNAVMLDNLYCMPCSIFGTRQCKQEYWQCTKIPVQQIIQKIQQSLLIGKETQQ